MFWIDRAAWTRATTSPNRHRGGVGGTDIDIDIDIDPDQPLPIYVRLTALLLQKILAGEYHGPDRLPTEHEEKLVSSGSILAILPPPLLSRC